MTSQKPLEEQIREWLTRSGHAFELRAAKAFRDAGWDVDHAQLYQDLDTGKSREIDLITTVGKGDRQTSSAIWLLWAIECKTSKHPWVIFTSSQRESGIGASAASLAAAYPASGVLIRAMDLRDAPTFALPKTLGHGIVLGMAKGESGGDPVGPYAALLGAVTAAGSLGREKASYWLRQGADISVIHAYLPLVLLEGRLFEVEVDAGGNEHVREVARSLVWVRNPSAENERVLVNVVTATDMARFAKQAFADFNLLAEKALVDAPDIWGKFRSSPGALAL